MMRRIVILVLIFALASGGVVWTQSWEEDERASRDVQRRAAWEFREMCLVMRYREKEAFITGFPLAITTEVWLDSYMFLELGLEEELESIIWAKRPKLKPTTKEVIRWVDFYYERERTEYADLGVVLWWFLHGNERPVGAEDPIRDWEKRIDERIYEKTEERRR